MADPRRKGTIFHSLEGTRRTSRGAPASWTPPPTTWRPPSAAPSSPSQARKPEQPAASTTYRPGIDGLRALAIVGVLLYHAGVRWVPGGFLGVDLFFVISGYLITKLLIAEVERTGQISFAGFFGRRARRLLPALGLLLVVTTAGLVLFWPQELTKVRGDIVASLGYVANWWFIVRHQSYFQGAGRPSPLQHLWSLAVEEQFYLLWPATVGLLLAGSATARRLKAVTAVAFTGAILSTVWMAVLASAHNVPYGADASRVYFGTDSHAMGVLIGAGVAALAAWAEQEGWAHRFRRMLDVAGVLGLAGVCWAMTHSSEFVPALYRGGFLVFAVLAALGVIAVGQAGSPLGNVLGQEPLRWLGTRSYSLYLWHWPIFVFTRPQLDVPLTGAGDLLLRLALTAGAAEASFRWIEQPIRARGLRPWLDGITSAANIPRAWRTATAAYAASVLILLGAGAFLLAGQTAGPAAGRTGGRPVVSSGPVSQGAPHPGPAPKPAAPAARAPAAPASPGAPAITAVGDSVMRGAIDELRQALPGVNIDAVEGRQARDVFTTIDTLLARGRLGNVVILQTGTNGTIDPAVLTELLGKLAGRKVIVLNVHVPRPWQNSDNTILAQAVRANGQADLIDWNAAASAHPQWLWDDGTHLRTAGARQYTDLIAAALH